MQYLRAYQFILDSKNWFMNILMGVICGFVPVLGGMVFGGYLFEVIDSLHEDPDHRKYPDFDFNRFMDYLKRGLWPVLVGLVLSLLLVAPLVIALYAAVIASIFTLGDSPAVMLLAIVGIMFLFVFCAALLDIVMLPAILHAGLARELRFGELIRFVPGFIARMWKELILVSLFLGLTGIFLIGVGAIVFCVGMYFAEVVVAVAYHHFMFQTYEVYLKRGGAPIRRAGESSVGTVEPV